MRPQGNCHRMQNQRVVLDSGYKSVSGVVEFGIKEREL
jgi:hypothetical protein